MQRIVQIGMEVEQQIDAGLLCGADIAKRLGRVGQATLRLGLELDAPQPLGDRPAKGRLGETQCKPGEQLDDTRLLDRLDEDDRGVRAQQNLQVVQVRHHRVHGLLGIHGASSPRLPADRGCNPRSRHRRRQLIQEPMRVTRSRIGRHGFDPPRSCPERDPGGTARARIAYNSLPKTRSLSYQTAARLRDHP